jgi:FkbM family methyltransferase
MDTKKGVRGFAEIARGIIFSWIFYCKRELGAMKTKLNISVLVDSIITFALTQSENKFRKTTFGDYLFRQYQVRVHARRQKMVEERFGVTYDSTRFFPCDTILNDYGQRSDFLPKEHDVIVDVGAHIGDWAIIVGKYYKARVIAIEPSKRPFQSLLDNIHLNGLGEQIIAMNCALFSEEKEIPVHIDEGSGFAVSTTKPDQATCKTRARTLDSVLKELKASRIDLLKIDTEGFEYEILKGATSTISRFRPKIIVEVHSETLRESVMRILLKSRYVLVYEKINYYNPYQDIISVLYFSPQ